MRCVCGVRVSADFSDVLKRKIDLRKCDLFVYLFTFFKRKKKN